ncbi:MAG: hypothetical protein AAGH15_19035 [Myxococcota bacterium]
MATQTNPSEPDVDLGFEDTPPKSNVIFIVGVLSALTLVMLVPLFDSYYQAVTEAELQDKVYSAGTEQVTELKAEHRRQLAEAPITIEAAKDEVAGRGRANGPVRAVANDGVGAPIDDAVAALGALQGWNGFPTAEGEARLAAAEAALRERVAREEAAIEAARLAAAAAAEGEAAE